VLKIPVNRQDFKSSTGENFRGILRKNTTLFLPSIKIVTVLMVFASFTVLQSRRCKAFNVFAHSGSDTPFFKPIVTLASNIKNPERKIRNYIG
jgi:hypothetical protein